MTNDYSASTRKTIIEDVRIDHHSPADGFFPDWVAKLNGSERSDVWIVWITSRTGMTPQTVRHFVFSSQDEAQIFSDRYPVGGVVREGLFDSAPQLQDFVRRNIDQASTHGFASPADPESFLIYNVLQKAGITDQSGEEPSQAVQEFLGSSRIEELKGIQKGVWGKSAEFEYCTLNLPPSSPAYIAAACRFHYYVTQDDFSAGYFLRELEFLAMGVEAEANKSREMRRNAGKKGSEKSADARRKRITSLMEALENVARRNPDVPKTLGIKHLLTLARDEAVKKEPKLWSQGQKQVEEYLGEIRRGEAGKSLQARYRRLFPTKTA